jgi:hypothetical protein
MAAATVTWPPPRPAEPEVAHRPWDPRHADEPTLVEEHDRLLYVVVDELVDDWVGLSVSSWPHADSEGRLRFVDTEPAAEVGTSRDKLLRFLGKDVSDDGAGLRVGTTFAVRVREGRAASLLERLRDRAGHGEARIENLAAFFEDPVDLTSQGRLIAKLASYGAMLSTLPTHVEEQWNLAEEQEP